MAGISSPIELDITSSQLQQQQALQQERAMRQMKKRIENAPDKEQKLREAAQGFEAIFLNKLWQEMRATVPKNGYLHSQQEEQYLSMFDQELSQKLADAGGIGLGEMLYKQLKMRSEIASKSTPPSENRNKMEIRDLNAPRNTSPLLTDHSPIPLKKNQPIEITQKPKVEQLYTPMEDYDESAVADAEQSPDQQTQTNMQQQQQPASTHRASSLPDEQEVLAAVDSLAQGVMTAQGATAAAPAAPLDITEAAQRRPTAPTPLATPSVSTKLRTTPQTPDAGLNTPVSETLQPASTPAPATPAKVEAPAPASAVEQAQPATQTSSLNLPPITWPVDGNVSSDFGWRSDPVSGKRDFHFGLDMAGKSGDPVKACWDGKVVFSGKKSGYGNLVILEHPGGWQSYYGHNSKNTVEVGQEITAGTQIAKIGSTGHSTGPHVHFEIRQHGLAWNPQQIQDRLLAGDVSNRDIS